MIEVQLNMMRIIERHDILVFAGKQLPGAAVAAVNDTLAELREMAVTALDSVVNAPRAEIDARVLVEPAIRESRISAVGSIYVSSALIPLKFFSPKQTSTGVTYSPIAGQQKTIKHAFGPTVPRLGNGVWKRVGKRRVPIEKVPGYSLAKSKTVAGILRRVAELADEILQRNIDIQVALFLGNLTSGRTTFGPTYVQRERKAVINWGRRVSVITATTTRRR